MINTAFEDRGMRLVVTKKQKGGIRFRLLDGRKVDFFLDPRERQQLVDFLNAPVYSYGGRRVYISSDKVTWYDDDGQRQRQTHDEFGLHESKIFNYCLDVIIDDEGFLVVTNDGAVELTFDFTITFADAAQSDDIRSDLMVLMCGSSGS